MKFFKSAFKEIRETVGRFPSETGGILLGNREDMVVQKFVFDKNGTVSSASYDPDIDFLNSVVKREWEENKLAFIGFVHSHPRSYAQLSPSWGQENIGDLGYIQTIFNNIPGLSSFLAPIVFSDYDKQEFKIMPFKADRGDVENYYKEELEIIKDKNYRAPKSIKKTMNTERLIGAVDVDLMKESHAVCIGIGGAQSLCEDLVRSGLGKITILDFDTVDETNVTTQAYNPGEFGMLKTEALRKRLLSINPYLDINAVNADFLELSEHEIEDLVQDADLLLMMTDNFYAQARGNRVALKYTIPAVHAMMYEKARCSEVFFSIPLVTPSCFRCAASSRYKAYLEEDYKNDITSSGSTVFHTRGLNVAIGMISLAILHNDTYGFEFSDWFGKYCERNFVQLRTHPKFSTKLFDAAGETNPAAFTFDSVWQRIEPERAPEYEVDCPDCGGYGHNHVINIQDTHVNVPEAEEIKTITEKIQ